VQKKYKQGERPGKVAASQGTSCSHTKATGVSSPGHLARAFNQLGLAHSGILLIRKVYFHHHGSHGLRGREVQYVKKKQNITVIKSCA